jgi:threonine/homoserine/homoserine lactone efflux protein
MLTIYSVTLLGVIAAQISPGPNLIAVASVALAQGRRTALFVVTGVASFLFGQGLSALHVLAFGPIGAVSGLMIYGIYAMLFSTGVAIRGYTRFSRWFEGLFAAAFSAMGASLVWSGVSDAQR